VSCLVEHGRLSKCYSAVVELAYTAAKKRPPERD